MAEMNEPEKLDRATLLAEANQRRRRRGTLKWE